MRIATYWCLLYLITLFPSQSKAQVSESHSLFDWPNQDPQNYIHYYHFYDGVQMIEIDLNAKIKAKAEWLDAVQPVSTYHRYFLIQNPIIFRNKEGKILAQYNMEFAQRLKDILPVDEVKVFRSHAEHAAKRTTYANHPQCGKHTIRVSIFGKFGLIDTLGNKLIPPAYQDIVAVGDHYLIKQEEQWGVASPTGEILISPQHKQIQYIRPGVLAVKTDKYKLIDYNNKALTKDSYTDIKYLLNHIFFRTKDRPYGVMDTLFQIHTPEIYTQVETYYDNRTRDLKFWVCTDSGCGFLDSNANALSALRYGLKPNWVHQVYRTTPLHTREWVYLDTNFQEIGTTYDTFEHLSRTKLYIVSQEGKYGLINADEEVVLPLIYDKIESNYRHTLNQISKDGKWGLINRQGKIVIPCVYDQVWLKKVGYHYLARQGENYGLVSEAGEAITSFIYKEIRNFQYTRARVLREGKIGYLDYDGKESIPCIYDSGGDFYFHKIWEIHAAQVELNGESFLIDDEGKRLD